VLGTLLVILALLSANFMRKLQAAQQELQLSASADSLTGLYNRRSAYERLAERYRQEIAATQIRAKQNLLQITVSIGITEAHPDSLETRDSLIDRADKALYVAKQEGRNRVAGLS